MDTIARSTIEFPAVNLFKAFCDRVEKFMQPKRITKFPARYYEIEEVEIDGEFGIAIYDFDRREEYVVFLAVSP